MTSQISFQETLVNQLEVLSKSFEYGENFLNKLANKQLSSDDIEEAYREGGYLVMDTTSPRSIVSSEQLAVVLVNNDIFKEKFDMGIYPGYVVDILTGGPAFHEFFGFVIAQRELRQGRYSASKVKEIIESGYSIKDRVMLIETILFEHIFRRMYRKFLNENYVDSGDEKLELHNTFKALGLIEDMKIKALGVSIDEDTKANYERRMSKWNAMAAMSVR